MAEEHGALRKKLKGKPVEFNRSSLKDFVTGFAKRKQARREYGAIQLAKKQRIARNAARKERRDAMKIQDRITGAFGDKLSDDSDDETGEASKGLDKGFPKKKAPASAAAAAEKQAAVHEDSVAVVTVVTREQNSDESEDDVSDDDEEEEEDEEGDADMSGSSRRQGIPFRRRDLDDSAAAAAAAASLPHGSSSTPYNPNKSHQSAALLKAKHALKSKDKFKAKGMSSKGGHKYKKPKIMSKKKKIKMGNKKGANRDK